MLKKTILLTCFLAAVGALSAGLIASVNELTAPMIEKRLVAEKEKAIQELFPQMTNYEEVMIEDETYQTLKCQYQVLENDTVIGYLFETNVNGYGGPIQALISYDVNSDTLQEMTYIGTFNETPGFGTRVQEPEFLDQVLNKPAAQMDVDTLSGATVTSKAVKQMIDEANAYYLSIK